MISMYQVYKISTLRIKDFMGQLIIITQYCFYLQQLHSNLK